MTSIYIKDRSILFAGFLATLFILMLPVSGFCEDTDAPVSTSIKIEGDADYTTSRSVSLTLSANDPGGVGVTGYYLSEDGNALSGETLPPFTSVTSTQIFSATVTFTLTEGDGSKTVYAWFKDAAGNTSAAASDSIILDTTEPADGLVQINDASGSVSTSQVTVIVSATDNLGIAGYRVSESSASPGGPDDFTLLETPVISLNASFNFTLSNSPGIKILYAWFIDMAGNISDAAHSSVDFTHGWVRLYGYSDETVEGNGITMDLSGNIYVVGTTEGDMGGNDNITLYGSAFVSKLSRTGDILWSSLLETTDSWTEGTVYSSRGDCITSDSSGYVYIGGEYDWSDTYSTPPDAFVAKFDSDGNQMWLKKFVSGSNSDLTRINGIGVDGSDSLYILGYTSGTLDLSDTETISWSEGNGNFLAKYNGSGELQWAVVLLPGDGYGNYFEGGMAVDASGNIYIAGYGLDGIDGLTGQGSGDVLLAMFNSSGEKQWSRLWGTSYTENANDISLGSSGYLYVTGLTTFDPEGGEDPASYTNCRSFVCRFSTDGNPETEGQWDKIINFLDPSDTSIWMNGVSVDTKGNVYVVGSIDPGPVGVIRKYSATGTLLWTKRLDLGSTDGYESLGLSDIYTGPGDVVFTTGQLNNYDPPGFAGQIASYMMSQYFVWKSGSDSLLDLTLPTGTVTINGGDASVMGKIVTLNLSATDNIGVTGYCVSESSTIPPPSAFIMVDETAAFSADIKYTFESAATGTKTVYVWYRDAFGNFTNPKSSDSIEVTGDTAPPIPGSVIINGGAEESELTTLSIEISATDNIAVTGYYLTEGYESPEPEDFTAVEPAQSFSATVSYTLKDTKPGTVYVYAYFIDAAGNINPYEDRAEGTITLADTTPPVTTVDPLSGYYDGPVTVTLTATDDSDVYIGETLFTSVVTKYTINGGEIIDYSDTGPFEINPPAVLRFLSADSYGYDFMGANYEAMQTATYGLSRSFSGNVAAGDTTSIDFEATDGSTLSISLSLNETSTTTIVLKRPDNTTYNTYSYTGGTMEISVKGAGGGTWSLQIDNSGGTTALDYQISVKEMPSAGSEDTRSIELGSGWNLVSLCQQPPDPPTINTVLESIEGKYISVWAYIAGSWQVYDPENPDFSDLTTMEAGKGYWINMIEAATLTISGSTPSNSTNLLSGWNLVGYNSDTGQDIAEALASIEGKYISVWAYVYGAWEVYDPENPDFSDLLLMEPDYGYWINAKEACTWTLP
ncbi:MAG: SBBP repeat-containing protein [Deltaproteobacteria bacterium]|nr:SBBP repeat-containing protein [Deltaproteobacteria bacterium]